MLCHRVSISLIEAGMRPGMHNLFTASKLGAGRHPELSLHRLDSSLEAWAIAEKSGKAVHCSLCNA